MISQPVFASSFFKIRADRLSKNAIIKAQNSDNKQNKNPKK